jgi:hypothetical protein
VEASRSGQDKERSRGESSIDDGVEKGPEQVIVEQERAQGKKAEDRAKIEASLEAAKLDYPVWQTGTYGFSRIRSEGKSKDYRARDNTITSLVSNGAHVQSEEKNSEDEGSEAERRSSREGGE